jgi:hypothetical protein
MMLEEQIKEYPVCNYVGGFSIKKGSRSMIESLHYTAALLTEKKNMVLIFPQGEIQSLYNHTIQFESGLEYIAKKIAGKSQIIFIANLVDYFSNPKPDLFIYFKEYDLSEPDLKLIQRDYSAFYAQCIQANIHKTGS